MTPAEGTSLLPVLHANTPLERKQLAWEHWDNRGIRQGQWKLVAVRKGDWELYDLQADRTELTDLAAEHPERVASMKADWQAWAERVGVFPK